jgi:hypothetical protein
MTVYYFYKFLLHQKPLYLGLTALFFGLAQASKFSAVILIPTLPLLYLFYYGLYGRHYNLIFSWRKAVKVFLVIFGTGMVIVWATYFFEFKKPLQDIEVQRLYIKQQEILTTNMIEDFSPLAQKVIRLTDPNTHSGQRIKKFLEDTPVPAYFYFRGLVQLYGHNYGGHTAYLLGHYTDFGWWYYFPLAFMVKEPLSLLLFMLWLLGFLLWRFIRNKRFRLLPWELWHSIPPWTYISVLTTLIYLAWSMTSHLNLGIRHIFIIFPFIFVGLGYLVTFRFKKQKYYTVAVSIFLIFYIVSSSSIYPHYLAYFNEAAGGPDNGPKYLTDSNIDWGQDLKNLKQYMVQHDINHVCLSYFGKGKIEYYNIDYWYLPDNENFHGTAALNCVVAISVTSLFSEEREYGWLLNYTPTAKIGYSIYLYDFRVF